ncbi:MAG: pantetheine-phosphate adenylyltransferase [Clostridia bacterium]|nr:pantetheine-phosphate adenylyltransferase [Clostridia bacterium]
MVSGSFDPVTLGHVDVVRRAAKLFDRVIVASVVNVEKEYRFTPEERVRFLEDAFSDLPNVSVEFSDGYLFELVLRHGACAIVRGLRSEQELPYELFMANYNREHTNGCDTIFLPAEAGLEHLSSSEVKRLSDEGQDITSLVTPMVAAALKNNKKEWMSHGNTANR